MTTEVRVPNVDGALIPGMYATASLTLPYPHRVYEVPATAVIHDAKGNRAAVVAADDTIHFVAVGVERDTGAMVEVASGLNGSERLVKLPSPDLAEGQAVDVVGSDAGAPPRASN
jgi:multidrug efflux pump subunit AcrA (membrane-fusion protein)